MVDPLGCRMCICETILSSFVNRRAIAVDILLD